MKSIQYSEQPGNTVKIYTGRSIIRINFAGLILLLISVSGIFISCSGIQKSPAELTFVVSFRDSTGIESNHLDLQIDPVIKTFGSRSLSKLWVKDLNNGKLLEPGYIDTNNDNRPDLFRFHTLITRDEPLRPFSILEGESRNGDLQIQKGDGQTDKALKFLFLTSCPEYLAGGNSVSNWSDQLANSILQTYPDPMDLEIFAPGEWTYTNAFFINSLCYFDELADTDLHFDYIKGWCDAFIDEAGRIDTLKYARNSFRLDDILPGRAYLHVYRKTQDEKYLNTALELLSQLKHQPRTSEGGYWHKKIYEWQMWLDGIYMSDVFVLQYANQMNEPKYYDEAVQQIELVHKHTHDPETGLLYHGWDESKSKIWADPVTGASPEFWGRGLGWYMMALVDALDYLPRNHPSYQTLLSLFSDLSESLRSYQDPSSGLWYQVVDKGDKEGNWPESSCTAMFAYAYMKGSKMGYLDKDFQVLAKKAIEGLKQNFIFFDEEGKIYLTGTVKVGTLNTAYSNGSYEYYISVDRRINDFKGIAALLYLSLADEYLK